MLCLLSNLYRKPTHSPQYLLPTSTHPPHCTKNIPFSLGYRLLRICSEPERLSERLQELKNMLLTRGYKPCAIKGAFSKLAHISREDALKKVEFDRSNNKVTFVMPFDPRLPKISSITKRHFDLMKEDPICEEIFKDGVQMAYKRSKNIKEILCRATLPPIGPRTSNRTLNGWKKCNKIVCNLCPYTKNISEFTVTATKELFEIKQKITCTDKNIIYCIECIKCKKQYVGKTKDSFKKRASEHKNTVRTEKSTTLGEHFNQAGHSISDMLFFGIEKVVKSDPFVLGARERFYIDRFGVLGKGLNKNRTN